MDDLELELDEPMKNPNLYIQMPSSGSLWSSSVFPWQEPLPWSFSQGY